MGARLGDVYMESMLCVCIYTYFEKKSPFLLETALEVTLIIAT